jgi:DNA-binding NtrC family response regulator
MSARAISQGHTSDFGASIRPWIGESPTLHCADRLWALLVYDAEEPLKAVEQILRDQGMGTRRVRRCSEAIAALGDSDPPKLVVTDTSLPDGGWSAVLKATCARPSYPPLIMVSRLADIRLYLDVIESGAYDFVVPPLASADLAYIVNGALMKSSHHISGTPQKDSASSSLRQPVTRSGANG